MFNAGDTIMKKAWFLPSGNFLVSRKFKNFNIS